MKLMKMASIKISCSCPWPVNVDIKIQAFEDELIKNNSNMLGWSLCDDEDNDDHDSDDENGHNVQADVIAISDFDLVIRT